MVSMDRRTACITAAFVAIPIASALVYFLISPGMAFLPFVFFFFPVGMFGRSRKDEPDDAEYCPECGYAVEPDEKFCTYCGRMLR